MANLWQDSASLGSHIVGDVVILEDHVVLGPRRHRSLIIKLVREELLTALLLSWGGVHFEEEAMIKSMHRTLVLAFQFMLEATENFGFWLDR